MYVRVYVHTLAGVLSVQVCACIRGQFNLLHGGGVGGGLTGVQSAPLRREMTRPGLMIPGENNET